MRTEPALDRTALIDQVRKLYRQPVEALSFLPVGEVGLAYLLEDGQGGRFFLKLWPDSRRGQAKRARLGSVLPVVRELHQRGLLENIAAPIPGADGALHASFDSYVMALFPYIDGRPLEECGEAAEIIARTLANLHHATPLLKTPLPAQPAFAVNFAVDLRHGLGALEGILPEARSGRRQLRALLFPRRAALTETLRSVEALRREAQRRAGPLVLCHTDLGKNALIDDHGRLFVIDWDDLILAPPEHDLQTCRDGDFAGFLAHYAQAGGETRLDPLQFRFYLLRRYLGDLVDCLIRILEENEDPQQDVADLYGIQNDALYHLYYFEEEMQRITQALEMYA